MRKKHLEMEEDENKCKVNISSWEQVAEEENRILHQILAVKTAEAVEAALSYARYLRGFGLDSENYHLFLRFLDIDSHWVTDTLIENGDIFEFFAPIPPNNYLFKKVFKMLSRWSPSGVYPKTLGVLLGILRKAHSDPRDGYRIYPLSIADVDNLGKHLDSGVVQDDIFNEFLLEILENISNIAGCDRDSIKEIVSKQAGKIRSTFFDDLKTMDSVIPPSLTIRGNYRESEVHPKKLYVN